MVVRDDLGNIISMRMLSFDTILKDSYGAELEAVRAGMFEAVSRVFLGIVLETDHIEISQTLKGSIPLPLKYYEAYRYLV